MQKIEAKRIEEEQTGLLPNKRKLKNLKKRIEQLKEQINAKQEAIEA